MKNSRKRLKKNVGESVLNVWYLGWFLSVGVVGPITWIIFGREVAQYPIYFGAGLLCLGILYAKLWDAFTPPGKQKQITLSSISPAAERLLVVTDVLPRTFQPVLETYSLSSEPLSCTLLGEERAKRFSLSEVRIGESGNWSARDEDFQEVVCELGWVLVLDEAEGAYLETDDFKECVQTPGDESYEEVIINDRYVGYWCWSSFGGPILLRTDGLPAPFLQIRFVN